MASKIPSKNDIKKEFDKLRRDLENNFKNEVENLVEIIKVATPVDTGFLRDSFQDLENISSKKRIAFRLVNTAPYSTQILLIGREGGRGSEQLPNGIFPIVYEWRNSL